MKFPVPKGQTINSHAIYGVELLRLNPSPEGTTDSFVPCGTRFEFQISHAINGVAINKSSYGAKKNIEHYF